MEGKSGTGLLIPMLAVMMLALVLPAANLPALAADGGGTEGQPAEADAADPAVLDAALENLAASSYGQYGIYTKDLQTGAQAGYQEDKPFVAASCYKLFLVMSIYERAAAGYADLDSAITLQGCDLQGEGGAIQGTPLGTAFTTRQLCMYAIVYSDNIAARMLRRVYGYQPYRDYATSIGCPVSGQYGNNLTTAREMAILLMRVLQFADVNPMGQEVLSFLRESVAGDLVQNGLPQEVEVANKTGSYKGYLNDAAVIFLQDKACILCVLSSGASGTTHAQAASLVYEDMLSRYPVQGGEQASDTSATVQRYFAAGTTREGYETWLHLVNDGYRGISATIQVYGSQLKAWDMEVEVPSRSSLSLHLKEFLRHNIDFFISVTSEAPLLVQRPLYSVCGGYWREAGCYPSRVGTATEWYIPGGSTRTGYGTLLWLANPSGTQANCTIRILSDLGEPLVIPVGLEPLGGMPLDMGQIAGKGLAISFCILSDSPILVERMVCPGYPDERTGQGEVERKEGDAQAGRP